ncbi:MAG TPA: zf-HC2 domain-containing protein, partial [Pyrinomonadaceae bacterium]|nr:zf-HC2 domain-containing protein [Pyrinomonadaceae bacterium]
MKECLDEGMLQAWLDGELSDESAEKTALHLTSCVTCADAAREMKSEMSLLATALATEFDVSVPTERLRNRIEDAIAQLQPSPVRAQSADRSWLQMFTDLFAVSPQRAFGYAAVAAALIAVVALGVIYLKGGEVSRGIEIANHDQPVTPVPAPASVPSPAPVETPDQPVTADNAPKKSMKRNSKREDAIAPVLIPG